MHTYTHTLARARKMYHLLCVRACVRVKALQLKVCVCMRVRTRKSVRLLESIYFDYLNWTRSL